MTNVPARAFPRMSTAATDAHGLQHGRPVTSPRPSHASALLALKAVHHIIETNQPITALSNRDFDAFDLASLSQDDQAWLKLNSLQSDSRHFDDASLPFPRLQHNKASIYASNPNNSTNQSLDAVKSKSNADATRKDAPVTERPSSNSDVPTAAAQEPATAPSDRTAASTLPSKDTGRKPADATEPMRKVAPPEPEDEANLTAATEELLNLEASPQKPAKTVHLPPKEVQEERLREQDAEKRQKTNGDGGRRLSHLQTQGDLASSPSSTVGAYSAATPMPPQDSPDTSPGSESNRVEVPQDLRPSPEEQRAKEEHDRQLEAQKEIARREALGDVNTPDDQLRWEEREAAARNAEEVAATEDVHGPEPNAKENSQPTEAEIVVEEKRAERVTEQVEAKNAATTDVAMDDSREAQQASQESDGENITVTPRNRPSKPAAAVENSDVSKGNEASTAAKSAIEPPQASKKAEKTATSLHEPVRKDIASDRKPSASHISPNLSRVEHSYHATQPQPAPQAPRYSPSQHTSAPNFAALSNLSTLKGAAEDPERDYLEPLFRIQAHDSPAIKTNALPDLLRSSTKTLSTEDHFTSIHERMDFRMLRRIYQLQNANKWSFRQMEKCREPPQPVTHHDNMMAEMKWMCKDFRAERKMKKSVCAWLAQRCADWVAADPDERKHMQVKVKAATTLPKKVERDESLPDLEMAGESATEDEGMPSTPKSSESMASRLVVDPELVGHVKALQKAGSLKKALHEVPEWKPVDDEKEMPITKVSKFTQGKVLPEQQHPMRKRSRFDYEDEDELQDQPSSKRLREETAMPPEDQEIALFHPENKPIRDRLHANNAFRPPSEFPMPSTPFYEYRNGSQWIWEDDQKLRKLAKDYSFNWSLIADEMNLPSAFKSGMERRTPWECFERWVDLEQLPAEMRKTVYFKTWYQRLELSQQAVERRYQAQVAAMQQAQQNNSNSQQQSHMPVKRRTQPMRVEKRKTTRYLWVVDAMRKLARKREAAMNKQIESQRAAAQRKSSQQNNEAPQERGPMPTPQQFSKTRYERDLQLAELNRQRRQKVLEAQQQQRNAHLRAQQGIQNGVPPQQRPQTAQTPQSGQPQMGQQHQGGNGQMPNQQRQGVPMAVRNGHLAVPHMNAQGVPQAPMRQNQGPNQTPDMQRMAHANNQGRPPQYANQQFAVPNGNTASPGVNGLSTSQQLASNQALIAAYQAQHQQANHGQQMPQSQQNPQQHQQQPQQPQQQQHQQHQQQGPHQQHQHHQTPNGQPNSQKTQANNNQQMSASPSMGPPPAPANPQQLSSGHVPAVIQIKNQLRARYPQMTEAELTNFATEQLKHQSQSSGQMRQNALNAAAGISTPQQQQQPQQNGTNTPPTYNHNQAAYQTNGNLANGPAGNAEQGTPSHPQQQQQYAQQQHPQQQGPQQQQQSPNVNGVGNAGNPQQNYAQLMRQRAMQQMHAQPAQQSPQAQSQTQSPNTPHARLSNGGSPRVPQASPHLNAASPRMATPSANASPSMHMAQPVQNQGQPRPPSRSQTPQQPPMQRLGSSGGVPAAGMQSGSGVQSPGGVAQGSPRAQQQQQQQQSQQQQQPQPPPQQQTGVAR